MNSLESRYIYASSLLDQSGFLNLWKTTQTGRDGRVEFAHLKDNYGAGDIDQARQDITDSIKASVSDLNSVYKKATQSSEGVMSFVNQEEGAQELIEHNTPLAIDFIKNRQDYAALVCFYLKVLQQKGIFSKNAGDAYVKWGWIPTLPFVVEDLAALIGATGVKALLQVSEARALLGFGGKTAMQQGMKFFQRSMIVGGADLIGFQNQVRNEELDFWSNTWGKGDMTKISDMKNRLSQERLNILLNAFAPDVGMGWGFVQDIFEPCNNI